MDNNHQRIGPVQIISLLAVLVFGGGFGWFIWQNGREIDQTYQQAARSDASASSISTSGVGGVCHSLDKSIEGHFYVAKGQAYSLCLPDGWQFLDITTAGDTLLGTGLRYQAGITPVVKSTAEGKDGPFELTVFASAASGVATPDSYTDAGEIHGLHLIGKKYTRIATANAGEGLGSMPAGTAQTIYVFTKNGTAVTIAYNIFPGDTDASAAVAQLAASINI